jgi:flagellar basal body-associated protein FliL
MVYKFDKVSLCYKKVKNVWIFLPYLAVIILLITCAISLFILNKTSSEKEIAVFAREKIIKQVSEEASRLKEENDILKNNEFSSEILWNFLLLLVDKTFNFLLVHYDNILFLPVLLNKTPL